MKVSDFDRIVCLCLDSRFHQWNSVINQFEKRGAKVERFIVGKGKILPKEMYNQIDPTHIPLSVNWQNGGLNNYCCYLSHREIIKKAKEDGLKNILLLEDDCELTEDFDTVLDKAAVQIENLGIKWDTLNWGTNIKWANATQVSPNLLKLNGGAYCWHAIAINQEHNDMFQHFLDLPANGVFDWLWSIHTQPNYKCYAVWPNIAFQKPGMSYLNGCLQNYTDWLKETGNNNVK